VLVGGLAILYAVLDELNIDTMIPATGAMRQGILYDMLGRFHNHDMRDVTVAQFMQRYHVDAHQALRVATFAVTLYEKIAGNAAHEDAPRLLGWAGRLHEIGIPVAYSGYHKHSAYIINNADMPGFSREEQERLATLVLCHRRALKKTWELLPSEDHMIVLALRLAVVLCRARRDTRFPPLEIKIQGERLRMAFDARWLESNPLTATALREEVAEWTRIGYDIRVPGLDDIVLAQEPALTE
jgi:exopolyphosphatase/guanosine-5'-triphosphate,3'-diphosphate pyrophosphatase